MFLLSVAVSICPAESAPAANASSSVAIASHCFPAAIRSLARSFSCYGKQWNIEYSYFWVSVTSYKTYRFKYRAVR